MAPQTIHHVLMTADTVGGVWTYALELSRGLAEYGVQVSLATMGDLPSPDQKLEALSVPNVQLLESNFKLEWMQDPWEDVRGASEWLLELEQRLRPDIVHLNSYCFGALPWKAPCVAVGHSCVLSWWRAVLEEECGAEWDRYRKEVTRGLRAATCVVTPSRTMLESLYRHYSPVPAGIVIPNGRSRDRFAPATKEPFILAAGRLWDKAKNIQLLDQVASDVRWPVRVAGEPHPPGFRQGARFGKLDKMGRLSPEALAEVYGRTSIYAAPAKYEPFGLSILEAALSGCVLALGDIPSLKEIWGSAAVYVDPNSPTALKRTLNNLIDSPLLRHNLAQRARRRALRYSLQRMTAAYLGLYQKLKTQRSRSHRSLRLAIPRGI